MLGFVKAMDFVDEQNCRQAGVFLAIGGGGEDAAHVGDVGFDAAKALEFAAGLVGNDLREGRFAGAGWAVENEGLDAVGFDGAAEQLAGSEDVFLAGEFVEIARAHARGERFLGNDVILRRGVGRRFFAWGGEKVVHVFNIGEESAKHQAPSSRETSNLKHQRASDRHLYDA